MSNHPAFTAIHISRVICRRHLYVINNFGQNVCGFLQVTSVWCQACIHFSTASKKCEIKRESPLAAGVFFRKIFSLFGIAIILLDDSHAAKTSKKLRLTKKSCIDHGINLLTKLISICCMFFSTVIILKGGSTSFLHQFMRIYIIHQRCISAFVFQVIFCIHLPPNFL